ncbi:MAG: hypothetical protein J7480_06125 [Microbacteriaceae bacterium]|nr:hypothetical protein [Microbacteriaceae bacterium]
MNAQSSRGVRAARQMKARREPKQRRTKWWLIGLAAFLVLDAALVWWAVSGRDGGVDRSQEALPLSAFGPAPTAAPATSAPRPATTSTPTQPPIGLEAHARRIVPVDSSIAWRVGTVACGGPVAIEETSDGGASWVAAPTGDDVAGVRDITVYTGDTSMVGILASLAGDCRPEYRLSYTAGEFWTAAPEETPSVTTVDPVGAATLSGPGGSVASPCGDVSEFAEDAGGIAILCTSTELRVGPADLSTWTPVALPGAAVAVTAAGDGFLAAARRDPDCVGGLRLSAFIPDGTVQPGHCLAGYADESVPVTLATAPDGALWLWAGDRVGVSVDGGASWTGLG